MSLGAFTRRPAVLLAFGLCLVGVLVSVLGRLASGPRLEPKRTQFTNEPGAHAYPAFSPDGKQVAYSAHGPATDDTFHLFIRAFPGGAPRELTGGSPSDIGPVWSPDGATLAFLRVEENAPRIMTIPASGGDPRTVAEFAAAGDEAQPAPSVAWTRDAKRLVVAGAEEGQPSALSVVPVNGGTAARITSPAKETPGDFSPAVSPDGATVAFVRRANTGDREAADVWVCDLSGGNAHALTYDGHAIRGIAWMPDGRELVYSSDRGSGWRLWRLPAYGGTPRDLLIAGHQAQFPTISHDGRLLFTERAAASSIWRAELGAPGVPVKDLKERPLLRSDSRELDPAVSPDGKRIANVSDQNSDEQIWVGDADGITPRFQLTQTPGMRLRNLRWSPDGTQLLYEARSQRGIETNKIVVKPNARPVRVLEGEGGASWSHDGKSIYYESRGQIWKAAADGSGARSITEHRRGGSGPEESEDGKYVYYRGWRTIWRTPSDGDKRDEKEEEAIVPEHDLVWSSIQPVKGGVYYLEWSHAQRSFVLVFYDIGAKRSTGVLTIKDVDQTGDAFRVSPDGKYVLYPKTDRNETNLVLVENFR
jgi:Tol biopolymer transport system component